MQQVKGIGHQGCGARKASGCCRHWRRAAIVVVVVVVFLQQHPWRLWAGCIFSGVHLFCLICHVLQGLAFRRRWFALLLLHDAHKTEPHFIHTQKHQLQLQLVLDLLPPPRLNNNSWENREKEEENSFEYSHYNSSSKCKFIDWLQPRKCSLKPPPPSSSTSQQQQQQTQIWQSLKKKKLWIWLLPLTISNCKLGANQFFDCKRHLCNLKSSSSSSQ